MLGFGGTKNKIKKKKLKKKKSSTTNIDAKIKITLKTTILTKCIKIFLNGMDQCSGETTEEIFGCVRP
jgi:hypothetical protein